MADSIYDENGNIPITTEVILEKLSVKMGRLELEIASLTAANEILQRELMKYMGNTASQVSVVK